MNPITKEPVYMIWGWDRPDSCQDTHCSQYKLYWMSIWSPQVGSLHPTLGSRLATMRNSYINTLSLLGEMNLPFPKSFYCWAASYPVSYCWGQYLHPGNVYINKPFHLGESQLVGMKTSILTSLYKQAVKAANMPQCLPLCFFKAMLPEAIFAAFATALFWDWPISELYTNLGFLS